MMIQPLLQSHSEPSPDGRTTADDESPNEVFARTLAESIRAARSGGPERSLRSVHHSPSRNGFERDDGRLDPRSEVAAGRLERDERATPANPSIDRPSRPEVSRSDDHRTGNRRPDDPGADESRAGARSGRVELARPGQTETERPGAQVVDPAGDPVRPETPGSGNGRRVLFAGETTGSDQSGLLEGDDAALAASLASLMGVDTGQAVAFLETLTAGLTHAPGVESAEQLMAQLAALAEQLGGGDTIGGDGVDGADTELVAAVIEAAVGAGLVEPIAPDTEADPAALLAALTSAISVAGTADPGTDESISVDSSPGTVVVSDDGSNLEAGSDLDIDGQLTDLDLDGSADTEIPDETTGPDGNAETETGSIGDVSGPDGGGETATGTPATDGSTEAAPDRVGPGPAVARPDGSSLANPSSTIPGGLGGVTGVATVRPAPTSPVTAPAPTPTEGLVELANTQLAEQLRPAFAAVRRGIDGMEELQLRLRNEGGAPIKVDIRTADGEIRVVLSGTNDDVMQRLGHERERLADELRRAGFTSTSIDVHSENAGDDHRRPGTGTPLESTSGRSFDTGATTEEAAVGAVSGIGRPAGTGLDLDL